VAADPLHLHYRRELNYLTRELTEREQLITRLKKELEVAERARRSAEYSRDIALRIAAKSG
jgi:hypothetical protein